MLAKKRVMNCTDIASSDFDELSFMAQALYVRLIADTDDMGVAEAGAVVRNASRMRLKALDELIDNGFVTLIRDKGKIVYLNGFHDNNSFTRYGARESRYMTELLHNDYTKNVINKVKMKPDSNHRIGNDMPTNDRTGEDEIGNADRYVNLSQNNEMLSGYELLRQTLYEWYQYTDERQMTKTTDTSINNLIKQCVKRCQEYGEGEVCDYIDKTIANTWNKINWEYFEEYHSKC